MFWWPSRNLNEKELRDKRREVLENSERDDRISTRKREDIGAKWISIE